MTSDGDDTQAGRPAGLRERKKARTRASIREHALALFARQGYHATTVEQIAEAAEISPSTFFRYYPTKEDVVLQDEFDVIALGAFLQQPAGMSPVAAFRAATRQTFGSLDEAGRTRMRETTLLTLTVPEVRARAVDELARSIDVIAAAFAERTGRTRRDPAVRAVAGAVIGVILSAAMTWAGQDASDLAGQLDEALAHLEAGLPL